MFFSLLEFLLIGLKKPANKISSVIFPDSILRHREILIMICSSISRKFFFVTKLKSDFFGEIQTFTFDEDDLWSTHRVYSSHKMLSPVFCTVVATLRHQKARENSDLQIYYPPFLMFNLNFEVKRRV